MSYSQMAQLELLDALNNINSEAELNEFKNVLAHYFANKAQKAIDALWDEGVINDEIIEQWGKEHMRTPYGYEAHRSGYQLSTADPTQPQSVPQDMDRGNGRPHQPVCQLGHPK